MFLAALLGRAMIQNVWPGCRTSGRSNNSRRYSSPDNRRRESCWTKFHNSTINALSVSRRSASSSASRYSGLCGRSFRAGAAGTTSNPPFCIRSTASDALPPKKFSPRIWRKFDATVVTVWSIPRGILLSRSGADHAYGLEKNPEVQGQAPAFHILQIESDIGVEGRVASGFDLPEPRNSGRGVEAPGMFKLVARDFARNGRTRADDAHVPYQHVPELRQFIERIFAHKAARPGDTRVLGNFEENAVPFIQMAEFLLELLGVADHGAEFIAAE